MPSISSQFPDIRDHILFKKNRRQKGTRQDYFAKRESRKRRAADISLNEQRQKFFDWIEAIQLKLELDDFKFAQRLFVNVQTLRLWKRRAGHYPSQRSLIILLKLERESNLSQKDFKVVYRIRL